jgi:hypothetical protein
MLETKDLLSLASRSIPKRAYQFAASFLPGLCKSTFGHCLGKMLACSMKDRKPLM